jgi:hypothetical protein
MLKKNPADPAASPSVEQARPEADEPRAPSGVTRGSATDELRTHSCGRGISPLSTLSGARASPCRARDIEAADKSTALQVVLRSDVRAMKGRCGVV